MTVKISLRSFTSALFFLASPWRILWQNRVLLRQLCQRDLTARYKGSGLGLIWSILNPLIMLAIYAFVFGEIFRSRWGNAPPPSTWSEKLNFALILYAGLIIFNWLAECLAKAPVCILGNANYVKRVVFPLEVLPVVPIVIGAFHLLMSFAVLVGFIMLSPTHVTAHWLAAPLLLFPYFLFLVGLAWFLSAIGVYFRDIEQVVPALTSVLMFLSPVFYSIQMLPAAFRPWLMANPLTFVIETQRNLLFWQQLPNPGVWVTLYLSALFMFYLGYACFKTLRRGFADVL